MADRARRTPVVTRLLKPAAFTAALLPLALLVHDFLTDNLSVNPLDDITDITGTWTLRFIVITLAITPLRTLTGWSGLARVRRMMGVYAFFYGTMHLFTYLYFDKFFDWAEIVRDIPKRRFILVGLSAWMLMVPLAVTSTDRMTRWLGGKAWKRLHRAVYLVGALGVVHYYWLVKFDTREPLIYGAIVAALLGFRMVEAVRKRIRNRGKGDGGEGRGSATSAPG